MAVAVAVAVAGYAGVVAVAGDSGRRAVDESILVFGPCLVGFTSVGFGWGELYRGVDSLEVFFYIKDQEGEEWY